MSSSRDGEAFYLPMLAPELSVSFDVKQLCGPGLNRMSCRGMSRRSFILKEFILAHEYSLWAWFKNSLCMNGPMEKSPMNKFSQVTSMNKFSGSGT